MFDGFGSLQCGGTPVTNNATCYGDATLFSATVVTCNGRHLFNASGLVEVTGDLRLNSLSTDIASVTLPNLALVERTCTSRMLKRPQRRSHSRCC